MLTWNFRRFIAAMVISPVCLAAAGTVQAQHSYVPTSMPGCAADECGDAVCGEGCCTEEGCYNTLDVKALFNHVAGDTPLLADLKNQKSGPLTYSVGGALRYRFMNEQNRLRPPGPGESDYHLWRFTPSLSVNYDDTVGGFIEGIDASAFGYDAPYSAVPIDENRTDLLRYYVELNVGDVGDGNVKYRYGRQFLKYGSQRLLSPLAWSNTFRNFEGHKVMYTSTDWDIDGFGMKSVNGAAGGAGYSATASDDADSDRWVAGVYSTYKGIENNDLDLYYIYFKDDTSSAARHDGERHTIGTRLGGKQAIKECDKVVGTWAWDLEGAYQFGRDEFGASGRTNVSAGMAAANLGYTFNNVAWAPSITGIFYWGSGDTDPASGDINTFYTLYPLGHAWWGQIDNFSGQNLIDACVRVGASPHEKLNVDFQWHHFSLAESQDSIYNIVGAPFAVSGASDIGQEIDIVATVPVTKNFNVQAGYFWFFYGGALAAGRPDADQFYLQTVWSF